MQFVIKVLHDRKTITLIAERIFQSEQVEKYKIAGRNRFIVLQTNRPVFVKRGLKHRTPEWKLIEGTMQYKSLLEVIIKELMKEIKRLGL